MKIKEVHIDEYHDLIKLMNLSFNFKKKEEQFETLLPKLYYRDNKNNIHLGVYVNNKLVASIGLYPMIFASPFSSLKVINIGGVSTHPKYRNKGYFKALMREAIKYADDKKYDLLILGGNRTRYNHFDFENAGMTFIFDLTKRKTTQLKIKKYQVETLNEDDQSAIKACLNIYLNNSQHVNRDINNFYLHLLSWRAKPYVIYSSKQVVGYFTKRDNDILEIGYLNGYKDTLFHALFSLCDKPEIYASLDEYNKDTLSKCDSYSLQHSGMAYILNDKKVCQYLGATTKDYLKAIKLEMKDRVRYLLGDGITPSVGKISLYIPYQDRC